VLVLEAEAVELERRPGVAFEFGNHRLAAARIAAHRVDADGIVGRHETRIDKRPEQRHRTGRIASGIGNFARSPDLAGLVGREFGKTVHPIGRDAMRRGSIEHLGRRCTHSVDECRRLLRGRIREAKNDEVHLLHQRALGGGILALLRRDAFHRNIALPIEALADAQPRRSGLAVNEDDGLAGEGLGGRLGFRLGVGESHGLFLGSMIVLFRGG